ncbi:MAG: GHMP kinase [Armatimonadetes bacterium]|nr:GHMP kinase [Armatimonadota bacterium]
MKALGVSAPGRICLFGEHQDYLGLPVMAAAVNLRIGIKGELTAGSTLRLRMPDIDQSLELDLGGDQSYVVGRDYLRSSVNVLRRMGLRWELGGDLEMRSTIPINAGVSSSSAMVVMWLGFLLGMAGRFGEYNGEDLARLGHQAEVTEFGEPGGMMDHYCAGMGGILSIDTVAPYGAKQWDVPLDGLVLGHSQQPKATVEMLRSRRADVAEGVRRIQRDMPSFSLRETPLAEAEPHLAALEPLLARRVRANLVNRELTRTAEASMEAGDLTELGPLLYAHHEQLRDGLNLSTDKLERMLDASMEAGALGGKVNGSGGGGCMFAYAPGCQDEVAEAIRRQGGIPFTVSVDSGVRIDT